MLERIVWILLLTAGAPVLKAGGFDPGVKQLIVSIAPSWDSSSGALQLFERTPRGWQAESGVIPVLYGKNGLAWGRGIRGTGEPGRTKVEKDGCAPAGLFKIGTIYTYDPQLPPGADYPFHQVNDGDAWVDDVQSPDYNKHVSVDPKNPPPWFEKQKMRHNDFAYRWLVEIRHNADPPVPGFGSAIFFHIRRGATRTTSGCTTMREEDLVKLVCWLRAAKHPEYLLLPWTEYRRKAEAWGLPPLQAVTALVSGK